MLQAAVGAIVAIAIAFVYQRAASAASCARRATTPLPPAPSGSRSTSSGWWRSRCRARSPASPGGLYVHYLPINADAVYLDLTFITLAMLVIGGMTSLWGAVVGALAVSGLDSLLAEAENGAVGIDLPSGSRIVVVGALMALVLILRPRGSRVGESCGFSGSHGPDR